jgi:hypothetical protein
MELMTAISVAAVVSDVRAQTVGTRWFVVELTDSDDRHYLAIYERLSALFLRSSLIASQVAGTLLWGMDSCMNHSTRLVGGWKYFIRELRAIAVAAPSR